MRAPTSLLAFGFALGAITASGCSPNPPTDGFFGCASAGNRCPAAFPYCDPTDDRCYATAPVDSGPRPDTGPAPDGGTRGREYGPCDTGCPAGLTCLTGACVTSCTGAAACTDARQCVPAMMGGPTACVPGCNPAAPDCSGFPNTRPRILMGGTICQCAPNSWP